MRKSYNERLFDGCLRKWLHLARFRWLKSVFEKYRPSLSCVIELGCFDGRVLDYIPPPIRYFGYDANWEGGLDLALKRQSANCQFFQCESPTQFANIKDDATVFISLETLEHIPVSILDGYLRKLTSVINGYVFITVPNEKGVLFAMKYVAKVMMGDAEKYSIKELFAAVLGKMNYVERCEHKGFDWEDLKKNLDQHFVPVEVSGVQFPRLPLWANPQIGMVFTSRAFKCAE